jgi:hypothetical protein
MNSLAVPTPKVPKSKGGRPRQFDAHLVLRIESDLEAEIRKLAESEDRTIASVLRIAVRKYMAERKAAA